MSAIQRNGLSTTSFTVTKKKNELTSVRNSEERLIDAAFRCEVLNLLALLVQKYLLYWYKSESKGRIMEAALRCEVYMCPHTTAATLCNRVATELSSRCEVYVCPHTTICVLILCVRNICVLILLYMCPHTPGLCSHMPQLFILLYMCPLLYMCLHNTSMCPHYICVLIL